MHSDKLLETMYDSKLVKIRDKVLEKFKSEAYKINKEYIFFGIERSLLDGWYCANDLEKIASLMRKAQAELKKEEG